MQLSRNPCHGLAPDSHSHRSRTWATSAQFLSLLAQLREFGSQMCRTLVCSDISLCRCRCFQLSARLRMAWGDGETVSTWLHAGMHRCGIRGWQVSKIDPSTPQEDAKAHLADKISTFIQARTVPAPT